MIKSDIEIQYNRTEIAVSKLLSWYGLSRSTYYGWADEPIKESRRYNPASVLEDEELAVVNYRVKHRNVGYRKFTWMMNDAEIAFLSESAVYSILSKHDLLGVESYNGAGAEDEYSQKPKHVHDHWHTDLAYVKIKGVFYFLSMILDGYSRYILGWELLTDMTTMSVKELLVQVRAKYPGGTPKLINDNGSCYISKDFKSLVSSLDIQQVFTRRNHPETNGKIERLNGTVRQEALRLHYPTSFSDAEEVIGNFVHFYNNKRLHAGIRYTTPVDVFHGRQQQVLNSRKTKLEAAKLARININKRIRRDADLSQFIN
jgi:transposase InsO family protein